TIRKVEYNSDFTILTCPPPRRGEVVADPCRGIRVNFLDYWHPAFRSFGSRKEKVPVRYDPFDIGYVYAFVKGSWLKCQAISHYETFHGRTERELHCLLEERRKTSASVNASRNVTMHRIASWFNDIHETEKRLESGQFAKAVTDVLTGHHPKPQSKSSSVIFSGRTYVSTGLLVKNKTSRHLLRELNYSFEWLPLFPPDEIVTDHKEVGNALRLYLSSIFTSIFQKEGFRGLVVKFVNFAVKFMLINGGQFNREAFCLNRLPHLSAGKRERR
ncbi:MAG TPA: hypothetical protein EYO33_03710, partial [Phycisphaerales bacterium]|nr:hypothetical protein [Phycisphaerales bacterium]